MASCTPVVRSRVDVVIVDADPGQRRALAGLIAERAVGRFPARVCASPAEALAAVGGGRRRS